MVMQRVRASIESSDRTVWQLAQHNQMILLTTNRNMKGEDSLEQVLREDNTPNSLLIVTVGSLGDIRFCPIAQCDLMLSENYDGL